MTDDAPLPEPANLKFLRLLVTVLTGTMIAGLILIITLLVIRLSASGPSLPDSITLPNGSEAAAFTVGDGWYAVVTKDNQILIYDAGNNNLRKTISLD